jgi:hypothetical protein
MRHEHLEDAPLLGWHKVEQVNRAASADDQGPNRVRETPHRRADARTRPLTEREACDAQMAACREDAMRLRNGAELSCR